MPDDPRADLETGGPTSAPRPSFARATRPALAIVIVVAVPAAIAVSAALIPSGTSTGTLIARGLVALSIGLVLIVVVRRMLRALVAPPPAPPTTVDARRADVVYECSVCGTLVRLEVAATAKPPRHCGEEMEPGISYQA